MPWPAVGRGLRGQRGNAVKAPLPATAGQQAGAGGRKQWPPVPLPDRDRDQTALAMTSAPGPRLAHSQHRTGNVTWQARQCRPFAPRTPCIAILIVPHCTATASALQAGRGQGAGGQWQQAAGKAGRDLAIYTSVPAPELVLWLFLSLDPLPHVSVRSLCHETRTQAALCLSCVRGFFWRHPNWPLVPQ